MAVGRLTVLLACPVGPFSSAGLAISAKFLEELEAYAALWPGQMRVIAEQDESWSSPFSTAYVNPEELGFELLLHSHEDVPAELVFADSSVVLCAIGRQYSRLAVEAKAAGVPIVFVTEYTYDTAVRIMKLQTTSKVLRLRRRLWLARNRRVQRKAIALATAIQCNGTPTFDELVDVARDRLLYFDSRIFERLLVDAKTLDHRLDHLAETKNPLRLVFSGRLDRMKGGTHLIGVAVELRRLGVDFTMSICGDGELSAELGQRIAGEGLQSSVTLRGAMNFADELMPFLRHQCDLFVCCHPQGDPSCTYLETMACGVPIVGFDNEALVGLAKRSSAAWTTPLGDEVALAGTIAGLAGDRAAIATRSRLARDFAYSHTFDITYQQRVEHLLSLAV